MMASNHRAYSQVIGDLESRLVRVARTETKKWFDNYLKGAIQYRGVKSPQVRSITHAWAIRHGIKTWSESKQRELVREIAAKKYAEDKFAAIFWVMEMSPEIQIECAQDWFADESIYDWSTCDWLCTRVLDPLVRDYDWAAERIGGWSCEEYLWQRRAAIVAFRSAVKDVNRHAQIRRIIDHLLPSDERFILTGIGWCLSDMAKVYPSQARSLFEAHLSSLSLEVIQRHTKHCLSDADRRRWIAQIKERTEKDIKEKKLNNATSKKSASTSGESTESTNSSTAPFDASKSGTKRKSSSPSRAEGRTSRKRRNS